MNWYKYNVQLSVENGSIIRMLYQYCVVQLNFANFIDLFFANIAKYLSAMNHFSNCIFKLCVSNLHKLIDFALYPPFLFIH